MRHLFGAGLRNGEFSLLEIREQVTTVELLHDDVNVVLVLEDVKQADYVRMLAHFKDFNLTTLELDILHGHILFRHYLDCNCLASLFVDGRFDKTKLAFSKSFVDLVVVKHVSVSDDIFDCIQPFYLFLFACEIIRTGFVWRKDQFERVQDSCAIQLFLSLILYEHTNQTVHTLVLLLFLVLVDVKLFA